MRTFVALAAAVVALTLTATAGADPPRSCEIEPFFYDDVSSIAFAGNEFVSVAYAARGSSELELPCHAGITLDQLGRLRIEKATGEIHGFTTTYPNRGSSDLALRGRARGSAACDADACTLDFVVANHGGGGLIELRLNGVMSRTTGILASLEVVSGFTQGSAPYFGSLGGGMS